MKFMIDRITSPWGLTIGMGLPVFTTCSHFRSNFKNVFDGMYRT